MQKLITEKTKLKDLSLNRLSTELYKWEGLLLLT